MKLRKEELDALGYAIALMDDSAPLGKPQEEKEWETRCRVASRALNKIRKNQGD